MKPKAGHCERSEESNGTFELGRETVKALDSPLRMIKNPCVVAFIRV